MEMPPGRLAGAFGATTLDEASRTVQCTFGTGAPVMRFSPMLGSYLESLDMSGADLSRADKGLMPVLDSHDQDSLNSVLGTVLNAAVKNGQGVATLKISNDDAWEKIKDGTAKGVSIGYRILQMKDVTPKGASVPSFVATSFEVFELSLVSVPADSSAMIRSNPKNNHECEIISAQSEGKNMKEANSEASVPSALQERTRIQQITSACRAAGMEQAIVDDYIARGVSAEEVRTAAFAKLESETSKGQKRSILNVEVSSTNEDALKAGQEEAIRARSNPDFKPSTDAAKLFLGQSVIGMHQLRFPRKLGETDMAYAQRSLTTSDLPNILANVAEKEMRQAYQAAPQSFKPFTKAGTLRNYKSANRLQLGDAPPLQALNEHGEVAMGSTVESKETIQLKRYLSGISFTKETIVNDDLSALSEFSSKYAQQAQNLESNLVYGVLTANAAMGDSIALFHASHSNLAGSGAVISVTSVGAAWAAMMKQTDLSGTYLNLQPKYLIVPPELMTVANQLVSTALLANAIGSVNPYAGRLTVIADARLSADSQTAWYLACDASQLPCLELATLEGQKGPQIYVEPNYKTPGQVRIVCEHNAGAAALDYRGLYKNPGA
jgi:hypothetical protein